MSEEQDFERIENLERLFIEEAWNPGREFVRPTDGEFANLYVGVLRKLDAAINDALVFAVMWEQHLNEDSTTTPPATPQPDA